MCVFACIYMMLCVSCIWFSVYRCANERDREREREAAVLIISLVFMNKHEFWI